MKHQSHAGILRRLKRSEGHLRAVVATLEDDDAFLSEVEVTLAQSFGIRHATLQVEAGDRACRLAPDHVV